MVRSPRSSPVEQGAQSGPEASSAQLCSEPPRPAGCHRSLPGKQNLLSDKARTVLTAGKTPVPNESHLIIRSCLKFQEPSPAVRGIRAVPGWARGPRGSGTAGQVRGPGHRPAKFPALPGVQQAPGPPSVRPSLPQYAAYLRGWSRPSRRLPAPLAPFAAARKFPDVSAGGREGRRERTRPLPGSPPPGRAPPLLPGSPCLPPAPGCAAESGGEGGRRGQQLGK